LLPTTTGFAFILSSVYRLPLIKLQGVAQVKHMLDKLLKKSGDTTGLAYVWTAIEKKRNLIATIFYNIAEGFMS
jgi:hypothetical protein